MMLLILVFLPLRFCSLSQLSIVLVMGGSSHSRCATLRKGCSSAFSNNPASTSIVSAGGRTRNGGCSRWNLQEQ